MAHIQSQGACAPLAPVHSAGGQSSSTSVLSSAIINCETDVLSTLLDTQAVQAEHLSRAVKFGTADVLERLFACDEAAALLSKSEQYLLAEACYADKLPAARVLLQHGVALDSQNMRLAFICCCDKQLVALLLEAGTKSLDAQHFTPAFAVLQAQPDLGTIISSSSSVFAWSLAVTVALVHSSVEVLQQLVTAGQVYGLSTKHVPECGNCLQIALEQELWMQADLLIDAG